MELGEFLLVLAASPEELEAFRKDPEGVADAHGLSAAARRALNTRQIDELRVELAAEAMLGDERATIVWIHKFEAFHWLFKDVGDES